jgi:hypothetical protein
MFLVVYKIKTNVCAQAGPRLTHAPSLPRALLPRSSFFTIIIHGPWRYAIPPLPPSVSWVFHRPLPPPAFSSSSSSLTISLKAHSYGCYKLSCKARSRGWDTKGSGWGSLDLTLTRLGQVRFIVGNVGIQHNKVQFSRMLMLHTFVQKCYKLVCVIANTHARCYDDFLTVLQVCFRIFVVAYVRSERYKLNWCLFCCEHTHTHTHKML